MDMEREDYLFDERFDSELDLDEDRADDATEL